MSLIVYSGLELFWRAGEVVPLRSDRRLIPPSQELQCDQNTLWSNFRHNMTRITEPNILCWFDWAGVCCWVCVFVFVFLCVCMCEPEEEGLMLRSDRRGGRVHQGTNSGKNQPRHSRRSTLTGMMAREIDNRGFIWTTVWWIWEDFVLRVKTHYGENFLSLCRELIVLCVV